MKNFYSVVIAVAIAGAAWPVHAQGQGEITLLAVGPMRAPTQKIVDAFQAKSGRTVKVTYGNGVETRRTVAKGQPLDVSLIIAPFPGALTSGSIVLESATPINNSHGHRRAKGAAEARHLDAGCGEEGAACGEADRL
jgi:hypothetical protein